MQKIIIITTIITKMLAANIPSGQACGYDYPLPHVYHPTTVEKISVSVVWEIVKTHLLKRYNIMDRI